MEKKLIKVARRQGWYVNYLMCDNCGCLHSTMYVVKGNETIHVCDYCGWCLELHEQVEVTSREI